MLNKDVSDAVVPNVSTFEPSSLDAARVAKQGSPAFDRRHLHQPSPVELAAQELSALIFAPGERLQEQRPTREFGISRSLLREALRVLTEQGLLEQTPLRGVRIVSLSEVGRREIYTLRHALELFAIEEALPSPAAEGVTAMEFTLAATWDAARLGT
ncbi:MAG: GntR family transcriptional regulator [Actinomycetota bacterium]|jgi:DNA-binding GntR family transcriptional regulator|nr:GntR family transcriptional regulator [Actinomycetota bacterium]